MNKTLLISTATILLIPLFGINFFISLFGNILLLILLIPLLVLLILFLTINSFKSNIKQCSVCGATIIGNESNCMYCGAILENIKDDKESNIVDASKETIEVEAEEIN